MGILAESGPQGEKGATGLVSLWKELISSKELVRISKLEGKIPQNVQNASLCTESPGRIRPVRNKRGC